MHEILTIYLIISLYLCIGYVIHSSCIREIYKDNYYSKVYNSLSEYRARYQLLPKLYIEYTKALDQALDLIYKFEF